MSDRSTGPTVSGPELFELETQGKRLLLDPDPGHGTRGRSTRLSSDSRGTPTSGCPEGGVQSLTRPRGVRVSV